MSFRNRLTLFFVAIVIVPMVSVAFVLFSLISDNEKGKADAELRARQQTAVNVYTQARQAADKLAPKVGTDARLADALRDGDDAAAKRRAAQLQKELGLVRLRISDRSGTRVDVGSRNAVAAATRTLEDADGAEFGRLQLSDRSAPVYAREVKRLAGLEVVVKGSRKVAAATVENPPDTTLPRVGVVELRGTDFRVASFPARGFGDEVISVSILSSLDQVESEIGRSRLLAGGVLAGFFILAITCAVLVSRSLQAQIGDFLEAARRLARGDFSAKVPTQGRDEFAELGTEFNTMASQLEQRLEDLRRERVRLESTLRRLGEAFASNLDRDALLAIGVRTTADGVGADGGRATGGEGERARGGELGDLEETVLRVEADALEKGEPSELSADSGSALAHPLRAAEGDEILGVVSVWRRGRPFAPSERELFHYLAGQVGISLENVRLHETVQRQAVTDELTGLSNHRRFQDTMASEVERARRFDASLGLVMLDIDNFKMVNDTYGHQVGDQVLAAVSRVLHEQSREIDEPARYGGEELAVVLPGTDLEGAFNLAERVRAGIERLEFPSANGGALRVTASFGAAAIPDSAVDHSGLIAAADSALYVAKRSGKNRTERAVREGARPPQ
ncbi:MAG: hypothetical protein AVDCRST_MAG85-1271 [uncultured Solirubrobacteraceae bacterium]|uniref:Uncharacterized protein n=1 Tax=uncultured Solirubrobacteraceae bacterium TaxID=1162706 RepID=A0A6J4S828_9ACTN|nr:MAG: hypothetical protein AVDCRST_MAG85-1271 [uncultured Solirubrobacteraceae bacterium]